MNKLKEWWIFESKNYNEDGEVFSDPTKSDFKYWESNNIKPIHVIEKSAYDELKAELEQVKEAYRSLAHHGLRAIEDQAEIAQLKAELKATLEGK